VIGPPDKPVPVLTWLTVPPPVPVAVSVTMPVPLPSSPETETPDPATICFTNWPDAAEDLVIELSRTVSATPERKA
jgi:hypothetical protein